MGRATIGTLPRWRPGEPLVAEKLDRPNREIERLREFVGPVPIASKGALPIRRFTIDTAAGSIKGDYLLCRPAGVTGGVVPIARPRMLRASLTVHDGVSFTYPSATERTATKAPDEETQFVTPAYVAGDEVLAVLVYGGTGVVTEGTPSPIYWLDLNVDARAWAAEAAE